MLHNSLRHHATSTGGGQNSKASPIARWWWKGLQYQHALGPQDPLPNDAAEDNNPILLHQPHSEFEDLDNDQMTNKSPGTNNIKSSKNDALSEGGGGSLGMNAGDDDDEQQQQQQQKFIARVFGVRSSAAFSFGQSTPSPDLKLMPLPPRQPEPLSLQAADCCSATSDAESWVPVTTPAVSAATVKTLRGAAIDSKQSSSWFPFGTAAAAAATPPAAASAATPPAAPFPGATPPGILSPTKPRLTAVNLHRLAAQFAGGDHSEDDDDDCDGDTASGTDAERQRERKHRTKKEDSRENDSTSPTEVSSAPVSPQLQKQQQQQRFDKAATSSVAKKQQSVVVVVNSKLQSSSKAISKSSSAVLISSAATIDEMDSNSNNNKQAADSDVAADDCASHFGDAKSAAAGGHDDAAWSDQSEAGNSSEGGADELRGWLEMTQLKMFRGRRGVSSATSVVSGMGGDETPSLQQLQQPQPQPQQRVVQQNNNNNSISVDSNKKPELMDQSPLQLPVFASESLGAPIGFRGRLRAAGVLGAHSDSNLDDEQYQQQSYHYVFPEGKAAVAGTTTTTTTVRTSPILGEPPHAKSMTALGAGGNSGQDGGSGDIVDEDLYYAPSDLAAATCGHEIFFFPSIVSSAAGLRAMKSALRSIQRAAMEEWFGPLAALVMMPPQQQQQQQQPSSSSMALVSPSFPLDAGRKAQ